MYSIIIPCRDRFNDFIDCIKSVLLSDHPVNSEIVIIDSSFGDQIEDYIKALSVTKIKVLYKRISPTEGSASKQRNIGIQIACQAWIAFLDSDDIWLKSKSQEVENFIINTTTSCHQKLLMFHRVKCFPAGQLPYPWSKNCLGSPTRKMNPIHWLIYGNPIVLSSVICRKKDLVSIGGFDEAIRNCEDLDVWIKLYNHGVDFRYCPRILCKYKIANSKLSQSTSNIVKGTEYVLKKNTSIMNTRQKLMSIKYKNYLYGSSYLAARTHRKRAKVLLKSSVAIFSAPRRSLITFIKILFF